MEFEGDVVFLSNPQDQIKHLRRVANGKENDIRVLKSRIEELEGLLAAARERISKVVGEKVSTGLKKFNKKAKRKKYPGMNTKPQPKRVLSPEMKVKLALNMARARQARSEKAALNQG